MARVLVVDDDPTVREVVTTYLRARGHQVEEVGDGESALEAMASLPADVVVLDVMLPGIDGFEVYRRLRTAHAVPVVMLTARGSEEDRISGLEIGADDYVTKPFSPRELALRVDSVLRRAGGGTGTGTGELPDVVTSGDLVVDHPRRSVTQAGSPLALTGREYDLLRFLVSHPGKTYSRDDLLREVWGWTVGDGSTVTVHVRRLREKVEADPTRPTRLQTVWGAGYLWEHPRGGGDEMAPRETT